MASNIRVTKDRVAMVLKSINGLTRNQVLVGVPSTTAERQPDPEDPTPLTNAEIGYIQEFGAPEANIPARPFLVPGLREAQDDVVRRYRAGAQAVLDGKVADVDQVHMTVGLVVQSAVRKKITDGPFAPLSPVTLAKRKARGRKGEKPLIDTGQLRNSVTYVVRPKG